MAVIEGRKVWFEGEGSEGDELSLLPVLIVMKCMISHKVIAHIS